MHLNLTHILRSGRKVLVADTSKPAPLQYKKGKSRRLYSAAVDFKGSVFAFSHMISKYNLSTEKSGKLLLSSEICRCNMRLMMWLSAIPYREEPVYDVSWQTPVCAKVALEHYNRLNEEDEHELVKAVDSVSFFFNGRWMHANFLAKSKGAKSCVDLVPKYFFAELKVGPDGKESCVSCIKMDPGNPQTRPVRGCKICPSRMFHPAAGGHRGVPVLHGAARGDQVETQAAPDLTA
ncbi:hypothetical protein PR202_gb10359 [Eleusine coracana subsp. coracana]|uniref:DUF3615 domain-containing protein n=1 Tax=Eleusine coracana subsp. coracana TaxID=191504 RepID=A0AAV5EKB1_ELECO|nr:hypothetical protein PR202_gb10359 [Eleusine coracana subsp. coracana]